MTFQVPRLPNFEGISFSELKAKKLAVMDEGTLYNFMKKVL